MRSLRRGRVVNKYVDTFMRDATSLGGGLFTLFLILMFYIVDKEIVAKRLFFSFLLIYPFVSLIRAVHFKQRPIPETYTNFIEKIDASSFPSIHAANSFYVAYVMQNAYASNPLSFFLFMMAAFVAYTRIYFKKHYADDVVAGAVLGLALGFFAVYYLIP